jgi:hypothetical protein
VMKCELTVGNNGHVTDVGRIVHETTDLQSICERPELFHLFDFLQYCSGDIPPRQ